MEQTIIDRLRKPVHSAIAARRELDLFRSEMRRWRRVEPLYKKLKASAVAANALSDIFGDDFRDSLNRLCAELNAYRPSRHGHDKNGSYTWVERELRGAARKAGPKKARRDPIERAILLTVHNRIREQLFPQKDRAGADRGASAKALRLTLRYVKFRYPEMFKSLTYDRLRKRLVSK